MNQKKKKNSKRKKIKIYKLFYQVSRIKIMNINKDTIDYDMKPTWA